MKLDAQFKMNSLDSLNPAVRLVELLSNPDIAMHVLELLKDSFKGCAALPHPPDLPAQTLEAASYEKIFQECFKN